LRVTVSDPAMSETTTLLRAGATDLVLRMAEAGTMLPDLTLDNPVRAIGEVSRDITGRSRVRLAHGRQLSALDIQREYLARAKDFAGSRGADAVSRRVLGLWERALVAAASLTWRQDCAYRARWHQRVTPRAAGREPSIRAGACGVPGWPRRRLLPVTGERAARRAARGLPACGTGTAAIR
jgi:hypothetical protein